jgi:hypothetical protein
LTPTKHRAKVCCFVPGTDNRQPDRSPIPFAGRVPVEGEMDANAGGFADRFVRPLFLGQRLQQRQAAGWVGRHAARHRPQHVSLKHLTGGDSFPDLLNFQNTSSPTQGKVVILAWGRSERVLR